MMNDNSKLISIRDQNRWTPGCPVFVRRVSVFLKEDGEYSIVCGYDSCSESPAGSFTADCTVYDSYGRNIRTVSGMLFEDGTAALDGITGASYATVEVTEAAGVWKASGEEPVEIDPPETVWDTDSLPEPLRSAAKKDGRLRYRPKKIKNGWICSCGHLNLETNGKCSGCGTGYAVNFPSGAPGADADGSPEDGDGTSENTLKQKLTSDTGRLSARFAGLAAAVLALVAVAVVMFILFAVPEIRYINARNDFGKGNYRESADGFAALGEYKDSTAMLDKALRYLYRDMTGLDMDPSELYVTSSEEEPWYSITEDGVLDFSRDKYDGSSIVIPHIVDGTVVRELSKSCFINCTFESVVLPATLRVIGEQSFMNCRQLKQIRISSGIEAIGPRAFVNCSTLETVVIPDNVTSIGPRAFNNCTGLKSLTLGKGITVIPAYSFSNCKALEAVKIAGNVGSVGEYAFEGCVSLSEVTFPGYGPEVRIDEGNECLTDRLQ